MYIYFDEKSEYNLEEKKNVQNNCGSYNIRKKSF